MKKILYLILAIHCLSACTKIEKITGEPDDDFQLTFTQIYNVKMSAYIDTILWAPNDYAVKIDQGGYSIQGNHYVRHSMKDTTFHIINLDFVFPCEVAVDTMFAGDDFYGFYLLDDNLTNTNDKEFDAQPNGVINIKSIDLTNKQVSGEFNFTGVFKNPLGFQIKRNITGGTFSFNYK
ncbi:MAG: hypothetical protein H7296_04270 [Bacteroidia bacterium]|nr:hypothetical protein [Bacteroidia bacterium]